MNYTLIRSPRQTISLEIAPDGTLIVRCPSRMKKQDIEAFVEAKRRWIEKHTTALADRPQLPPFTQEELQNLARQAYWTIPDRLKHFAPLVGVSYNRVTIRAQRTRWGSCSGKGNLNFNCLLMLVPPEVLDYVVVHELCHRKVLNHSEEFWAQVEAILPDYPIYRQWLKTEGSALIHRVPK